MIYILLLLLDQYLKYVSLHHGWTTTSYPFFNLTLVKNQGVSLGFLGNTSWLLLSSIQISVLIWILTLKLPRSVKTLVLAGGISNIIDRLYHGFVIDYIQLHIGPYQWPAVINLADFYLTLALLIWILYQQKT